MERLLSPEPGLMIWTIITFLCLVFVLKKLAWGPLIKAVEDREARIKADLDAARAAREAAQKAQSEIDAHIASLGVKTRQAMDEAAEQAESLRLRIHREAEAEAEKIRSRTLEELERERMRLSSELRREVADLSIRAAEKVLRGSIDAELQKKTVDRFLADLKIKTGS